MKVMNGVFGNEEKKLTKMLNEAARYNTETIVIDGKKTKGYLFGNDEMFDGNEFYQLFVVYGSNKIYKVYFDVDVNSFDSFDDIDYSKPYKRVLSEYYTK